MLFNLDNFYYFIILQYLTTTDLSPSELVQQIRDEIFAETKLTASAGKKKIWFQNYNDYFIFVYYNNYYWLISRGLIFNFLGIAANRMLAKICSDINKPNGQYFLPMDRDSIMEFTKNLSLRKVMIYLSLFFF